MFICRAAEEIGKELSSLFSGRANVETGVVVWLFLTGRGEVGTGIITWLGRVAGKGVWYVPQLGKTYGKYCSWGVIVVDEGTVRERVGGMFIFFSKGARDVVGSVAVVGCGSVMVFCVAFKRFLMNLGRHFEINHLGTNFFVKDKVVETGVKVFVGVFVGTGVGIGIDVGAVVGIGTDVRAVVVIVAEAAEVKVSVGTNVGIGTDVGAVVVIVAGTAEVILTGSIMGWEVISEVVGTDVVANVGTFVRAGRGAIAEKEGCVGTVVGMVVRTEVSKGSKRSIRVVSVTFVWVGVQVW